MATINKIENSAADVNAINEFALALERDEFGIGRDPDPALMVPNTPGFSKAHPGSFFWDAHPRIAAYYHARNAELESVRLHISKQPHKQLADAKQQHARSKAEVARRLRLRRNGYHDGGMRRLVGDQIFTEAAERSIRAISQHINEAKAARDKKNEAELKASRDRLRELGFLP